MRITSLRFEADQIKFGTDGWRGVIGVDITVERMLEVAVASAQELAFQAPLEINSKKVVIGYDRRFMAPEFAEAITHAIRGCNLEPLLTSTSVTTPSCSWAVVQNKALGALVITASHNPPEWLGLKIKGHWGGSVESEFTKAVEKRLLGGVCVVPNFQKTSTFNARRQHIEGLKANFDIPRLIKGLKKMGLKLIIDPMHGSAAGCITEVFGAESNELIEEIRKERDPFFGGNPPEPLSIYLKEIIAAVKNSMEEGRPAIGIVFDGDGDRIAAIDETGQFCSTQLLMPLFIDHLARVKNIPGCVIKTVSGSDLMKLVAEDLDREVVELPVGFKYIAAEMLSRKVLIGGEESGGIGFGEHLPERDALYAALMLIEAIISSGKLLSNRLIDLQKTYINTFYQRVDLNLENMNYKYKLEAIIKNSPPQFISNQPVKEITFTDGIKLRLDIGDWIMFRFSGTEPLLRIYCEGPTKELVENRLDWAKRFVRAL